MFRCYENAPLQVGSYEQAMQLCLVHVVTNMMTVMQLHHR